MRVSRRLRRGQAVTETALAVMVMVTVVLFGIHFAEVGYASVKTHEAAAFAAWSGTGRKIHSMPGGTLGGYAGASATAAQSRYGAGAITALTSSSGAQVQCGAAGGMSGVISPGLGPFPLTGGMSCTAESRIAPVRIPDGFAQEESRGFFQARHRTRTINSCAFGRSSGGACRGSVGILLGEWQVDAPDDVPGNPPFSETARAIWTENGEAQGDEAIRLAQKYAGYSPYDLPFEMRVNDAHTRTVEPGSPGRFLAGH